MSKSGIDWPAMKEGVKACMVALLARLSWLVTRREKNSKEKKMVEWFGA